MSLLHQKSEPFKRTLISLCGTATSNVALSIIKGGGGGVWLFGWIRDPCPLTNESMIGLRHLKICTLVADKQNFKIQDRI